ncbi:hypothetical protein FQZ97_944390 [compost metagenome]
MHLRHRHRHAARDPGHTQQGLQRAGREPERAFAVWAGAGLRSGDRLRRGHVWRTAPQHQRQRQHHQQAEHADADVGLAPATVVDEVLDHRWPDGAGQVVAAHADRQRDAAAAGEPARGVGHQRRKRGRGAQQADQDALRQAELPQVLGRTRDDETQTQSDGAAEHRHHHTKAVRQTPHEDAAQAESDHGQRVGQRGVATCHVKVGLDARQHHRDRIHARAAQRHQRQ